MPHFLGDNEHVEADSGYAALDPEFMKTPRGFTRRYERKEIQNKFRACHKTVNKRFKQWVFLKNIFRHDLSHHSSVFRSISVLTQLSISFGEPLFTVVYDSYR